MFFEWRQKAADRLGQIDWEDSAIHRLSKEFDYDTAIRTNNFYQDHAVPEGDMEQRYDKITARLYRIYPERFLEQPFQEDALNKIYSFMEQVESGKDYGIVPREYYESLTLDEVEKTDAVFLDHNAVFGVMVKRDTYPGWLHEQIDIDSFDEDFLEEYRIPWHKPLDVMDAVHQLNKAHESKIDLLYPADTLEDTGDGPGKHIPYEVSDHLAAVAQPWDYSGASNKSMPHTLSDDDDTRITTTLEAAYDNPLVITSDRDFVALTQNTESNALPAELADLALRAILDRKNG